MSEVKPVASIKTLARYEPDTVYIGSGEYVADCFRADDGEYYLAEDVDAAIDALRTENERLQARVVNLEVELAAHQRRGEALIFLMLCDGHIEEAGGFYRATGTLRWFPTKIESINAAIDQQLAAMRGEEEQL